jgi:drug/metabolite transporter (DMT)-like permease
MDRRAWILFGVLAAVWGASYLFIKVGLDDLSAPMIVFTRTLLAALVLLPVAAKLGALDGLGERIGPIFLLASVQVAAPFLLITFGEEHISSSLAGILVASAPIWTAVLAIWVDQDERSHGWSLAGVVLGMAGVVLLLGVDAGGGTAALAGGLMVVLASLGYALGAFYLKRRFTGLAPVGVGAATMGATALLTAPFGLATAPGSLPGAGAVSAVAALGIFGTGLAFWIFYFLIGSVGPAKATLVAYVAPGFAVIYGVTFLSERFTVGTAAGLFLIVGGSWLAAEGRLPLRRSAASRQLAAGGVDVAAASQADGRLEPAGLERRLEGRDRLARGAAEA